MSRTLLVVEDDEAIRDSLAELLEDAGHQVVTAENGAEGFVRLEAMRPAPDLIFLDLMMPVKDGFAFRAQQLADPRFARIPVVIMSADPRLGGRGDQLAARSYLRKPFDIPRLLAEAAA